MSPTPGNYAGVLKAHYEQVWKGRASVKRWPEGPVSDLPSGFCVLEFSPTSKRNMWTYATCCMSSVDDEAPLELHLFSPTQRDDHVELLTATAHYHRTGAKLGLGHTVNFGRPWMPGSKCTHGLISLPYLDGPTLEWLSVEGTGQKVRFLWLVPVTPEEVNFKKTEGLEALEERLEAANFNYVDPTRGSVV